ncbi:hypothetical protein ACJX0J_040977 [Zea mays]
MMYSAQLYMWSIWESLGVPFLFFTFTTFKAQPLFHVQKRCNNHTSSHENLMLDAYFRLSRFNMEPQSHLESGVLLDVRTVLPQGEEGKLLSKHLKNTFFKVYQINMFTYYPSSLQELVLIYIN